MLEQGPYAVNVATPSDRGPLNGVRRDRGRQAQRPLHAARTKTRRTVSYRSRVRHLGPPAELERAADQRRRCCACSRATAARARASSSATRRPPAPTAATACKVRAAASRLTQIAWRSHTKDPGFQESAYVTLHARASSSLKARPRSVGVGGRLRLSGTVRGTIPSRGVPLIFQGRSGHGPLHDVRRRPREPQGPLQRPLPLPLGRLARAHVQLPRQAPRRRALPLRVRLLQARDRPRPLRQPAETK